VPYIGAFIAALFRLALAAAVDPGWSMWLRDAVRLCLDAASARGQATPIEIRELAALRDDAA
jgi:hypothetical protein